MTTSSIEILFTGASLKIYFSQADMKILVHIELLNSITQLPKESNLFFKVTAVTVA
jgi:hypothetical protein